MKLQNPSLRKRKGFTLIELIVVIAILAILAAIAIPSFIQVTKNANDKSTLANQRIAAAAVTLYLAENSTLPTVDTDLDPYIEGGWAALDNQPKGATYTFTYAAAAGTDPATVTISAESPGGGTITDVVITG